MRAVTTMEVNRRAAEYERETVRMYPDGPIARQALDDMLNPKHFGGVPLYEITRAGETEIHPPVRLPGYRLLKARRFERGRLETA